jgi:hypothetical protein
MPASHTGDYPGGAGIAEPSNRQSLISTLRVDQVTGEVAEALHQAGVRPLLLKGPGIARWLYGDGAARGYGDTDLLVSPTDRDCAERTLSGLGFAPGQQSWGGVSRPWSRGTDHVDLHRSIIGVRADSAVLWTHEELLAADGLYAQLFAAQAAPYR